MCRPIQRPLQTNPKIPKSARHRSRADRLLSSKPPLSDRSALSAAQIDDEARFESAGIQRDLSRGARMITAAVETTKCKLKVFRAAGDRLVRSSFA